MCGHYGHGHFGQNRKQTAKNRPLYINNNILLFIYSEQVTRFRK